MRKGSLEKKRARDLYLWLATKIDLDIVANARYNNMHFLEAMKFCFTVSIFQNMISIVRVNFFHVEDEKQNRSRVSMVHCTRKHGVGRYISTDSATDVGKFLSI